MINTKKLGVAGQKFLILNVVIVVITFAIIKKMDLAY